MDEKQNIISLLKILVSILFTFALFYSCDKNSASIPGKVRKFDPVASYEKVHAFAGKDTKLISIYAYLVKSDGTLDIKAKYNPSVTYTFYRPVHEEVIKEGGPLGSGIKEQKNVYTSELIIVTITKPHHYSVSINNNPPTTHYDPGMNRSNSFNNLEYEDIAVGPPGYSLGYIWEQALKREIPSDAVAVITYDYKGYQFEIRDTTIFFQFDLYGQMIE